MDTLPEAIPPATPDVAPSCPMCGASRGSSGPCTACGEPGLGGTADGLWRSGTNLVIEPGRVLPRRCLKTGRTDDLCWRPYLRDWKSAGAVLVFVATAAVMFYLGRIDNGLLWLSIAVGIGVASSGKQNWRPVLGTHYHREYVRRRWAGYGKTGLVAFVILAVGLGLGYDSIRGIDWTIPVLAAVFAAAAQVIGTLLSMDKTPLCELSVREDGRTVLSAVHPDLLALLPEERPAGDSPAPPAGTTA